MTTNTLELTIGDETHTVAAEWAICETCHGEGRVLNPSIALHVYTKEDMDDDPSFEEEYRKGAKGAYGVDCGCDHGRRLVPVFPNDKEGKALQRRWRAHVEEVKRDNEAWLQEIRTQERMGGLF